MMGQYIDMGMCVRLKKQKKRGEFGPYKLENLLVGKKRGKK